MTPFNLLPASLPTHSIATTEEKETLQSQTDAAMLLRDVMQKLNALTSQWSAPSEQDPSPSLEETSMKAKQDIGPAIAPAKPGKPQSAADLAWESVDTAAAMHRDMEIAYSVMRTTLDRCRKTLNESNLISWNPDAWSSLELARKHAAAVRRMLHRIAKETVDRWLELHKAEKASSAP